MSEKDQLTHSLLLSVKRYIRKGIPPELRGQVRKLNACDRVLQDLLNLLQLRKGMVTLQWSKNQNGSQWRSLFRTG